MAWTQADAARLWPWLLPLTGPPGHITQRFKGGYANSGENGIDLGIPMGTPITSLTYGTVLAAGYYGGGGVVSVESTLPGLGVASVYYQHLDENKRKPGDVVHPGDLIGYSGGQLSGGHHPATCCSTGPHMEIGVNAPFGKQSLWRPLGPNVDPMPWLLNLVKNGPSAADMLGTHLDNTTAGTVLDASSARATNLVRGTGTISDSFLSIEQALDYVMSGIPWGAPRNPADPSQGNWGDPQTVNIGPAQFQLPNIGDIIGWFAANTLGWGLRLACFLIALIIILAFIVNLMKPLAQDLGPTAVGAATLAA